MRYKLIIIVIALLGCENLFSQQFNRLGNPMITYFSKDENIPDQTWCITQDLQGIMYFGTDEGILQYDGKSFRSIATDSKVLSMSVDSTSGVVYVGLEKDFGCLIPSGNGSLTYSSLNMLLPDSLRSNIAAIEKTYQFNNEILFCNRNYIFVLNDNQITPIKLPRYSFFSSVCNDQIIVGNIDYGLLHITDNEAVIDKYSSQLKEKDTYSVLPISAEILWVITNDGMFRYNQKTKQISRISDSYGILASLPNEGVIPYYSNILGNGNIGIGCVNTSLYSFMEISPKGELLNVINKNSGFEGTQVTNFFQRNKNSLWLTFYDGPLARVDALSPIKHFSQSNGLEGVISSINRINGKLYVGTSNGVFYLDFTKNGFPKFTKIQESDIWALLNYELPNGNKIPLVASVYGVQKIDGQNVVSFSKTIDELEPFTMSLLQSTKNPNRIYLGTSNTIYSIDCRNGRAINKSLKQVISSQENVGEIKTMVEDKYGNIWASSSTKHLICLDTNNNFHNFESVSEIQGLVTPVIYNDSLFVLTSNGILHFNYEDSTFAKGGIVGHLLDNANVSQMAPYNNGFIFVCFDSKNETYRIEYIQRDSTKGFSYYSLPFKRLPKKRISSIFVDNGTLWMGIQKELYSFTPTDVASEMESEILNNEFHSLIRRVEFKDSVVFNGAYLEIDSEGNNTIVLNQPKSQIHKLDYEYNAVMFNYSATFYENEENTLFSHILEGSDETKWTQWDTRTEATYTNLREGEYIFHVKAKNIYGKESIVSSYAFEICPPWYRTILAYIFYVILFVAIIWVVFKWNMRRLIAEKERLEKIVQERTAEVVAQKEEIEGQKIHIEKQNEEITSSIQYASRIQRAILSPEEQVNTIFPDNFILYLPRDIVSGDFYVIMQVGNKKISVVADCTGHGVPGGFMSMLGMSSLSEIINKNADNLHANIILNLLREKIITSLHQTGEVGTSKDGMDLALYIVDETEMTLEYAGANNSLVLIRDNEIIQIKADKMPIGIYLKGDLPFTNNLMELKKGDVIYTFSDGYADQFGGADARKFMIKNLKNLFLEIHQKPMSEQHDILEETLRNWHGESPRIDDVVVMGVRIN